MKTLPFNGELAKQEIDFWRVPALSVSIVKEGYEPFHASYGLKNVDKNLKSDEHTNFVIASCSKAMTSAVIGILVDKGLLEYDKPVKEYIPEFGMYDKEAGEKLTIRDALCHRSGLGGHDAIWPSVKNMEEFVLSFKYLVPCLPFREKAQYSNIMYSVPALCASKVTGLPWNQVIKKYLFDPLEMNESYASYKETIEDKNIATPYGIVDNILTELTYWNMDAAAAAAAVSSNAVDMCKWLNFLISKGKDKNGNPLLTEETFKGMITAQMPYEGALGTDPSLYPTSGYALGWQPGVYKGHPYAKHMGKIEGFSAVQIFFPDDKLGIAMTMNLHSPSVSVLHTILYSTLDEILGEEKTDWIETFRGGVTVDADTYRDCDENLYDELYPTAVQKDIPAEEGSAGIYEDKGYGVIEIEDNNGTLTMKYNGRVHVLKSYIGCPYRIEKLREDIIMFDLPLSFLKDKDGKIFALKVRFEPMTDDIIFYKK